MNNMRRGFTMIELIFVIVIIGILAAVAIPKLAATRDDAKISAIVGNTRTVLGDLSAFYTSQGNDNWKANAVGSYVGDVTNVLLFTDATCATEATATTPISGAAGDTFYLCNGDVECVSFLTEPEGNLTITTTGTATDPVCLGLSLDPAIIGIAGAATVGKEHAFGGVGVVR